ncbi:MAG: hypothetical protein R3E31_22530 [Chloroflexota bacterium]
MGIQFNWQRTMDTGFILGNRLYDPQQSENLADRSICAAVLVVQIYDGNITGTEANYDLPDYSHILKATATLNGGHVLHAQDNTLQAFFHAKHSGKQQTSQAVMTAFTLMDQVTAINQYRHTIGASSLRISIGIDTGPITIHVNHYSANTQATGKSLQIADDLCELNKQAPFPAIFISAQTYQYLPESVSWQVENLGDTLWAAQQTLAVYALMPC